MSKQTTQSTFLYGTKYKRDDILNRRDFGNATFHQNTAIDVRMWKGNGPAFKKPVPFFSGCFRVHLEPGAVHVLQGLRIQNELCL